MILQQTPDYILTTDKPTFKEKRWVFVFNSTDYKACNELNKLLDMQLKNEQYLIALLELMKKYPLDVDIAYHIADYYYQIGQNLLSYTYTQSAVSLAFQALGKFSWSNNKLDYGELNNRPFFRAYSFLARHYYEFGLIDEVIVICNRLISAHPDDKVGARYFLVNCYQQQNNSRALNTLCKKYPDEDLTINAKGL